MESVFTLGVLGACCRGNSVLLVRTEYGSTKWQIPGGYVERAEPLQSALVREFMEELGVRPAILGVVGTYIREFINDISIVFLVDIPVDEIVIDGVEVQEAKFFSLADFPSQASIRTRKIAEDVLFGSHVRVVVFPSSTHPGVELNWPHSCSSELGGTETSWPGLHGSQSPSFRFSLRSDIREETKLEQNVNRCGGDCDC